MSLGLIPGCSIRVYRRQLARDQANRCFYCGCPLVEPPARGGPCPPRAATLDHRVPVSRGGTDDPNNICVSCYQCNVLKGCSTEEEFRVLREKAREAVR